MKQGMVTGAIVAAFCVCLGQPLRSAEAADPGALIAAAEKASASGDKVSALKGYMDAANALRASGAPQAKMEACEAARDALALELFRQIAEMQKQQAEVVQLQRGIAQRTAKVAQTEADIQARVKKNENKIKDIETILLDIAK